MGLFERMTQTGEATEKEMSDVVGLGVEGYRQWGLVNRHKASLGQLCLAVWVMREDFKALEQSRASKRLLGYELTSGEDHWSLWDRTHSFPENSGIYFLYLASESQSWKRNHPHRLCPIFSDGKTVPRERRQLAQGQEHYWNLRSLGRWLSSLIGPGTNYRLF